MGSDVASRRPSIIGDIPGHWERMTLGEAAARVGGDVQTGPFGSQLHASDYVPVGIPSIMPVNIGDNVIVDKGIARITEEDAKRLAKYRVAADDIIYSRRGDVERRALVTKKESGWLCGTGCLRVRLGAGLNSKFMSYQLGHPAVREWIVRHAVGATMPNLNTKILSSVPVVIPPLAVQRRIAAILGSLDDKIEANRKVAKTLEAIASAIFKSWFVDFDPIRAKIAGATSWPSMPQAAFDALPTAFVETETGEVPKGWDVGCVEDLCIQINSGGTPARKNANFWENGDIAWFKTGELSDGPLLDSSEHITDKGLERSSCKLWPIPESVISLLYLGEIAFNINDLSVEWLLPCG